MAQTKIDQDGTTIAATTDKHGKLISVTVSCEPGSELAHWPVVNLTEIHSLFGVYPSTNGHSAAPAVKSTVEPEAAPQKATPAKRAAPKKTTTTTTKAVPARKTTTAKTAAPKASQAERTYNRLDSDTEAAIIKAFATENPIPSVRELADRHHVPQYTMQGWVSRLLKQEKISRETTTA